MGYLTGTESESVGSAVCLKPGILAVLYLHKQTVNHFSSHEGKQEWDGRVKHLKASYQQLICGEHTLLVASGLITVLVTCVALY